MKIIAYQASTHRKGNGARVLKNMLEGAVSKGAETKVVLLSKQEIKHCIGCTKCFMENPELPIGECVLDDDMKGLLEEYLQADGFIFASPVYDMGLASLMKKFVERKAALMYRPKDAYVKLPSARRAWDTKKKAVLVVTAFCPEDFKEVMGDPCFDAMEAHFLIEQVEVVNKFYMGGVETLTDEDYAERDKQAFDVGVCLAEEIKKAQEEA